MGVPRRCSLKELACFPRSMVWLNWFCALFFFMVLALPGCRGATWTEEDERLARERYLGRITSRARNNGRTLGDFTSSKPFGSLSSQTRGSSPRTLGGFVSSSGSVQSPLSQVLRGSSSRAKFGGFSSDGFPSSQTSSSASQTSSGSSRQGSSSGSSSRQGSSSGSSPRQGSSARQGSSSGSSRRPGPSASYIPNFIGQSRGGFVIPQNIDTVYQNAFQTSSPRNSGPFQRPSQSFTDPTSGSSQASTDRISGSFQVSRIMDKSSQTSSISGCKSCQLVLQGASSQASTDRISGTFQVSQIMDKSSRISGCKSCQLVLQGA